MLDFSFRFDALSHRSSGNSLNVSENMGVVSKTSTPLSGSLENLGGGELLRKNFGGANSTSSQRCVLISFRSLTDCVVFSSPYFWEGHNIKMHFIGLRMVMGNAVLKATQSQIGCLILSCYSNQWLDEKLTTLISLILLKMGLNWKYLLRFSCLLCLQS